MGHIALLSYWGAAIRQEKRAQGLRENGNAPNAVGYCIIDRDKQYSASVSAY